MIDQMANLNLSYLVELSKNAQGAIRQLETLKQYLVDHKCTFKGEPMPTLLKPNFISPKQTQVLQYAVENISSALNKFIGLYLQNPSIREILKFSAAEEELFFIEPGYSLPLVIARLDAFMDDYTVKFLEFNCDSPAGTAYSDGLEDGFRTILAEHSYIDQWKIDFFRRQESLLAALLSCYNEFRSGRPALPKEPTIAIVDWETVSTASEFEMLQEFFQSRGIKTIITSPQKLKLAGEQISVKGEPVHLIYRRVITRELIEKLDQVQDFIQAAQRGYICVCNPFRSYIVGNKKILSLLTDPRFQSIYNAEELECIQRTIPWTKILADTKATYQGFTIDLRAFVKDNREKLVIKPAASYGGKDVFLGRETDQQIWVKLVDDNIASEDWVVQEFVPIPQEIYPVIDHTVTMQLKKVNINPFALLGKYCGTITRISDSSIINVSAGGGLVPTMSAMRKRDIKLG